MSLIGRITASSGLISANMNAILAQIDGILSGTVAANVTIDGTFVAGSLSNGTVTIVDGVGANFTLITSDAFVGDLTGDVTGDLTGTILTASQTNITRVGTLTELTVDNIKIDANSITGLADANITISAKTGYKVDIEGVLFDGAIVTGLTSITSTAIIGTLSTAAQTNITSLGTLTALNVDNININENTISSVSGNIGLSPVAGSSVIIDSNINIDGSAITCLSVDADLTLTAYAGRAIVVEGVSFDNKVVTGLTAITSTTITGTLATAAQTNITSLGTLTVLNVDNIGINGNAITSSTGDITITPDGELKLNKLYDHNGIILGNLGKEGSTSVATDVITAAKFKAFETSDISSVLVSFGAGISAGNIKVGIYSDNSGTPNALLADSDGVALDTDASYQTVSYSLRSTIRLTKNTTYWIAVWTDSTFNLHTWNEVSDAKIGYGKTVTYAADFPATFPSSPSAKTGIAVAAR